MCKFKNRMTKMYKNQNDNFSCPYFISSPTENYISMCDVCQNHQCPYYVNAQLYNPYFDYPFSNLYYQNTYDTDFNGDYYTDDNDYMDDTMYYEIMDYGPEPFVVDINDITEQNNTFRTALWTGDNLQLTLMSIDVGDEIGLEVHPDVDQFLRIEEGDGIILMGNSQDNLDFQERVYEDTAILIPAGKWHNLINTGNTPLKLYSIYAPPQHPRGTVHETRDEAMAAEENEQ